MKKIVIIGSPGAGKTTLARALGPMLNIKVYHLDRFFWECGWKAKARDTRIDILQNLVREKQWIIEGTYLHLFDLHLEAADTIIFLDISPLLCSQRLMKRHREYYRRSRRDIPERCIDRLTMSRILKVLTFPLHGLQIIKQALCNYNSKRIIWLHSPEEVEDFLAYQRVSSSIEPKRQGMIRTTNHCRCVSSQMCAALLECLFGKLDFIKSERIERPIWP